MKPLTELRTGECAYIVDLDITICERFFNLGCFPGDLIQVVENKSGKDFMTISYKDLEFPIYKHAAKKVITNVVSFQIHLN